MKRDIYAYITTLLLFLAAGFSIFLIVSDNLMPFTTQATIKTTTIDIYPEVKGYIQKLYVKEGQVVKTGERLFTIDDSEYQIALNRAQASLNLAQAEAEQSRRYFNRVTSLSKKSLMSEETREEAEATLKVKQSQVETAQSALKLAKLNVERTTTYAKHSGTVTNLTYAVGGYASTSSPIIHLVDNQNLWIEADFTEKGLRYLQQQSAVNIVYDALPTHVYRGYVSSVDNAISSGISNAHSLSVITNESRWIRPQQKIRVRINTTLPNHYLIAGSRASVMLDDGYHISDIWMSILSWLRVVY